MRSWTIASKSTLTVTTDSGETLVTTKSNPNWERLLEALRANRGDEVVRLMSIKEGIADFFEGNVAIKGDEVWYGNQKLHGLDVQRTIELIQLKVPVEPMAKFLNAKMANPSRRAVDELYKFLDHKQMPITPNGTILGYKGVRADYYSINGNTETVVLKGKVDESGHIFNGIGEEIEVARNSVDDDYKNGCSKGLHIGSREYAEGWAGADGHVMLVEFSPADAVCVPEDCECSKLRACKYIVRGEVPRQQNSAEMNNTYTEAYTPPAEKANDDYDQTCPECGGVSSDGEICGDCEYDKCQYPDNDDESGFYSEPEKAPVVENNKDVSQSEYNKGYAVGSKDGKAHKSRLYGSRVPAAGQYAHGYCDGYKDARKKGDGGW
jgi:hypothetical protein